MHKIEVHHKQNLFSIHLNGFLGSNRESFISEIERAVTDLNRGFSCIINLSKYAIISSKELHDLANLLYAYGLKTIVYVNERNTTHPIPEETQIFCNREDIGIYQVATLKDAEEVLSAETV